MSNLSDVEDALKLLRLDWCDYNPDNNVRYKTITLEKVKIIEIFNIVKSAWGVLGSIAAGSGPGFPTTDIAIFDYPSGLDASIYLALSGFYRHAVSCLRDWMEIQLLAIYFGLVKYDETYDNWLDGKFEAPTGRFLIKRLFQRHEFWKIDQQFNLKSNLQSLYGELCKYVHGGGLRNYDFQVKNREKIIYNSEAFNLWLLYLKRVSTEIIFCNYVAYGPSIVSELVEEEVNGLLSFLPPMYREEILKEIT